MRREYLARTGGLTRRCAPRAPMTSIVAWQIEPGEPVQARRGAVGERDDTGTQGGGHRLGAERRAERRPAATMPRISRTSAPSATSRSSTARLTPASRACPHDATPCWPAISANSARGPRRRRTAGKRCSCFPWVSRDRQSGNGNHRDVVSRWATSEGGGMPGTRGRVVAALFGERGSVFPSAGTDAGAIRPTTTVPADLRINEIQVLGTHNSYHVEPPPDILTAYLGRRPGRDRPRVHARAAHDPARGPGHPRSSSSMSSATPYGDLFRPLGTARLEGAPHRADRRRVHLPDARRLPRPRSRSGRWATPTTCP